jgi:cytochrome d ubiquinol oxidase subunit I
LQIRGRGANYLMVLDALWLWRKRQVYMDVYRFWLKVLH